MKSSVNSMINQALFLIACSYQARRVDGETFVVPAEWGYKLVNKLKLPPPFRPESFGFVMENKKHIVIAFKGTGLQLFDLAIDLDLFQTPFRFVPMGGKTHRGFTFVYGLLRKQLISTISHLHQRSPNKTVFVSGHSMGGALATLAGLDLAINTAYKKPKVYTSASPRVGDPHFVAAFNQAIQESVRIANVHDYIPLQPQANIFPPFIRSGLFYRHVKTLFPLNFQCKSKPFALFRNHMIQNYFNALRQRDRNFANRMCEANPGFCPKMTDDPCQLRLETIPFFRK
ncbi:lipase family protein [Laceyella putida]|uniref:Lipase family protein n=1 Tax=Laceyella putida TaxID=110101 RepID=A0ABW2RM22_9BACL